MATQDRRRSASCPGPRTLRLGRRPGVRPLAAIICPHCRADNRADSSPPGDPVLPVDAQARNIDFRNRLEPSRRVGAKAPSAGAPERDRRDGVVAAFFPPRQPLPKNDQ